MSCDLVWRNDPLSVLYSQSNRGFAAVAPEYVLSSITTLSPDFQPVIEQDGVVSINDSHDWSEEEDEADAEEDEEFYLEDVSGQTTFPLAPIPSSHIHLAVP